MCGFRNAHSLGLSLERIRTIDVRSGEPRDTHESSEAFVKFEDDDPFKFQPTLNGFQKSVRGPEREVRDAVALLEVGHDLMRVFEEEEEEGKKRYV